MGKVLQWVDRLTNVMSGMGTSVDRRTRSGYVFTPMSGQDAEAGYRTSWLARKIIDVPPLDMTREWRDWQADGTDIEGIEKEERRLQLREKCKRALVLSRLYGGGALILGTGESDPMQPLNPESIGKDGLKWVHVMAPQQLSLGQPITDPESEWFQQPAYFEITAHSQSRVRLHPSRVVSFIGQRAPEGAFYQTTSWFWGDPIMLSIGEAVKNADLAQSGFAALIDRAAIDVVKIPDLMAVWSTDEHEERLMNRLAAAHAGKSTWRMLAIDGAEEWNQVQISWDGMPEIMSAFLNVVAGAADIPVTRLLGQSPKGLQSTGDGEERDYHSMVKARQDELLAPALDRIDELLVRSALGSKPDDVYYEFAQLGHTNEKEEAEIEKAYADAAKTYVDTGIIREETMQAISRNAMIERGNWPGCEAAFEEGDKLPPEEEEPDEADLLTAAEKAEALRKSGAVTEDQATLLIADARPRSLYVRRNLINAAEFIRWAKKQGFETTLPAGDMHVTVLFSKAHVDWLKMGASWSEDEKGQLTAAPGGARIVEPLGDKGAVVLLFNSSALAWRHEEMVRNGASHDFDAYQPHVTITYAKPEGLDLGGVEPYRGKLVFGPEIFEEIDEGWAANLTEA